MNGQKLLLEVHLRSEHEQMNCCVDTSVSDVLLDALRFSAHSAPRVKSSTLEHEHFSTNALHCGAVTDIRQKRFLVQGLFSQVT
jgi:hypothetical protein